MIQQILYSIPPIILFGYLANRLYFSGRRCKSKNKLNGKTVIITGSNCGIGYETALDLAKRGARVILACRTKSKGEEAVRTIQMKSQNDNVIFEMLDLNSLKSVKHFADRIKSKYTKIDILINNAGLSAPEYKETEDGFENAFGVNHLGHFYLTNLLLDTIKSSAPSRIINVSSLAHSFINHEVDWENIQSKLKSKYDGFDSYKYSKLANVLFTAELAKRLNGTGVSVVSLHPGFVRTEIFEKSMAGFSFFKYTLFQLLINVFRPIIFMVSRNSWEGAQTTIHCAVDDQIPNESGKYFYNCKVYPTSEQGKNMASAEKLWNISMKMLDSKVKS